ncbi:MAG: spore coat protein [Bacilli bacterium]|nr:spore coat protein [Bacilli bacterium]
MSKIENPKQELPMGVNINDKDILNCLLTECKTIEKNYATCMTEASNDLLFKEYKKLFDTISKFQREVFEVLFQKGWYILEEAEGKKVGEKYNTLNTCLQELEEEE